jgi:hypothetical protein
VATRKGSILGVRLYLGMQATHVMMDRHKKTRNQEVKKIGLPWWLVDPLLDDEGDSGILIKHGT